MFHPSGQNGGINQDWEDLVRESHWMLDRTGRSFSTPPLPQCTLTPQHDGLRHLKRVTSDITIKNPPCGTTGANWTDWCHPDSIKEPFSHGKEAIDGAYTAAQEYEDKLSGKMNSQMMP